MTNKRLKVTLDGQSYEVEVREMGGDALQVTVNGQVHRLTVEEIKAESGAASSVPASTPVPSKPRREAQSVQPAVAQAGVLTAPMPGDIVELRVKVGDTVAPGDVVAVLEAMKMKNMLRSAQHGTVTEIMVSMGQSVEYGAPLARFE